MAIIASAAVNRFRNAKRDSHDWMKELKESELDKMLRRVKFEQNPKLEPLDKHQKVCILLGIAYRTFAFWLDLGGGKTRVCLELIQYWYKRGQLNRALVIAPSDTVLIGWEKQIKEWQIKVPHVTLLNSSTKDKWSQIDELEKGIIFSTAIGAAWLVSQKKEVGKGKRKKIKLRNNRALVKKLSRGLDAVIIDESTLIGHRNLYYKTLVKLAKTAKYRLELTGTPFGRDPEMLWSELYFVDRGETLGSTLGMFRSAFFETTQNYWGGYVHKFKKKYKKQFHQIIKHRSIQYSEQEMDHKHKVLHQVEEVILPQEATSYYDRMRTALAMMHNIKEKDNIFLRMRQISSGFLGAKNDDTGERVQIEFAHNPKLERLIELIQQVPRNRKFVIFHEFIYSGKMITQALNKLKIKHGWIRGGMKDSREVQHAFDTDPNFRGLVVNHKKGAYGTNLQAANYEFIYEAPVPVIDDKQMRKRLPRKGQKRTVHSYDLVARGTADQSILKWHREGGDLFEALVRGKRAK